MISSPSVVGEFGIENSYHSENIPASPNQVGIALRSPLHQPKLAGIINRVNEINLDPVGL